MDEATIINASPRSAPSFSAATLHYLLGFMPIYFSPVIIIALATSGATALNAAKIGSGAVILSTVATLIAPAFFNRFRSRALARLPAIAALITAGILGLGLAKGAFAVSAILILSTASGVLVAAAIKQEAQHKDADRRLGYLTALGTALIALLLFGMGWLEIHNEPTYFFCIWAVLLIPAVLFTHDFVGQAFGAGQNLQHGNADITNRLNDPKVIFFLIGVVMVFALTGGIYVFAGNYLEFIGVGTAVLITVLAVCVAAEVAGALCVGMALRFITPKIATSIGVALICMGTSAALYASNEFTFAVALAIYGVGFFWAMVAVLVWARDIDSTGSLATVAQGVINLMFAAGTIPFLVLMESKGLVTVTIVQVAASVLGLIMLLVLARIFSRDLSIR